MSESYDSYLKQRLADLAVKPKKSRSLVFSEVPQANIVELDCSVFQTFLDHGTPFSLKNSRGTPPVESV